MTVCTVYNCSEAIKASSRVAVKIDCFPRFSTCTKNGKWNGCRPRRLWAEFASSYGTAETSLSPSMITVRSTRRKTLGISVSYVVYSIHMNIICELYLVWYFSHLYLTHGNKYKTVRPS